MQLGVQPTFRASDPMPALVVGPPFSARRPEAVRCALRYVAAIMMVFCSALSDASPSIIRAKTPMTPHRFQRMQRLFAGPYSRRASHHLNPLRLMKTVPLITCRSPNCRPGLMRREWRLVIRFWSCRPPDFGSRWSRWRGIASLWIECPAKVRPLGGKKCLPRRKTWLRGVTHCLA
jgi:hypothetical protein